MKRKQVWWVTTITITTEYLTLGQMLKEAGIIDSGGQAKPFLATETVLVNGEADDRRGRKLYPGDTVTLADGQTFTIAAAQ